MFTKKTTPLAVAAALCVAPAAFAQDADTDSIPDNADAFPCDPALAGLMFAPGENQHGMLLFEDLWPEVADEDFNDVAIAYNYVYFLDANSQVVRVRATLTPLALGGLYDNGLGLRLPVAASNVASVTRTIAGAPAETLTPSSTDAQLTVIVSDNLRELFGGTAGPINADATTNRVLGQRIVVDVQLSTPVAQFSGSAPHDLYIFRLSHPGLEIHQRNYAGTSQMDVSYFGTQDDNSSAGNWYVDQFGLPSALVVPLSAPYPQELTSIATLFPNIITWAQSGGTQNQDFYASNVASAYAYQDASGQGAYTPPAPASILRDRTCVATDVTFNQNITVDASNIGTLEDQNWIIPSGVTVTLQYDQPFRVNALDVQGVLQHASCSLSGCSSLQIEVASDATVHPGGAIRADGRGYLGSRQAGNGYTARTRGNVTANASASTGGSHGGFGGAGGTVANTYDDVYHPVFPGSGGTSASNSNASYRGGNGGGVIRLDVAGTLAINGQISANGGRGAAYDSGGAGGSIWLTAGNITSTQTGVAVVADGAYGYYAGGGGGRIAIYGPRSGWTVPGHVHAEGGTSRSSNLYGGPGTIVYGDTDAAAQSNLLVDATSSRNARYSDLRVGAFGNVTSVSATTLNTARTLEPGALAGHTLRPDAEQHATVTIVNNTATSITITGGDLTTMTAAGRPFYVTDYATQFNSVSIGQTARVDAGVFNVAGDFAIADTAQLDIYEIAADRILMTNGASMNTFDNTARIYSQADSTVNTAWTVNATTMTLSNSARLRSWAGTLSRIYPLTIVATDLDIGSGAIVESDGRGYLGSRQAGNGYTARTFGNNTANASASTGGSHGGYGGAGGTVAQLYGNPYFPNTAGTGGTSASNSNASYRGGNGGGILRISVANLFTLDGVVSAGGGRGAAYDSGGAGGSIWIDANQILRNTTGVALRVNGAYGYYAGGGGGRVAVHYGQLSGWVVDSATVQALPGTSRSSNLYGGPGTILYRQLSEPNGRLLIASPHNARYADTQLGAYGTVNAVNGQTLTVSGRLVPGSLVGTTVNPDITQGQTFTVASNTTNAITVVEAGLDAATAAGRSFSVLDYQTQFEEVIVEGDANLSVGQLTISQNLVVRDTATLDAHDIFSTNVDVSGGTDLYTQTLGGDAIVLGGSSLTTLQDLRATTLDLAGNATVRNWAPTLAAVYPLYIQANTMTQANNASIVTSGRGYLGSRQGGNGYTARTLGNSTASASASTGGSHGGYGGAGGTVAATYGDPVWPLTIGSGGTSASNSNASYRGGNGGSSIHIVVGGMYTLDGFVRSDGGRGAAYDSGGAGGSVLIEAGTINSSATGHRVTANGAYGYYAGGGGGRVALHYDAINGFTPDDTMISVGGGGSRSSNLYGGSGTIVAWPRAQVNPNLLVTAAVNFNARFGRTPIGAFGNVSSVNQTVLTSSRHLEPNVLVGFDLVPDAEDPATLFPIVANSATSITVLGDMTGATSPGRRWYVEGFSTTWEDVTFRGDVNVEAGHLDVLDEYLHEEQADLYLSHLDLDLAQIIDSAVITGIRLTANDLDTAGSPYLLLRLLESATLDLGGSTRVHAWAPSLAAVYGLTVLADTMSMGTSAHLDATARGYLGSRQGGNGYSARTNGNVTASGSASTGGSHGGLGGPVSGNVTPTFGSATQPVTFGAGGTSASNSNASYRGGNGGSAVRVIVAGAFAFDGRIHASGGRGAAYDSGGAGGSVWVTAGNLNASGGRLEANGAYGYYAGGGGGRIAVEAANVSDWASSGITATVNEGASRSTNLYGQPGTLSLNGG
ncbi:MAG: LruC domain-containing protein [Deltaproteobacteria bacterium]